MVNVDTTTTLGLQRAKRLRLVQSEVARVIVVRSIFEANELFDELPSVFGESAGFLSPPQANSQSGTTNVAPTKHVARPTHRR